MRALEERPPLREQPEEGVTYAEKIGPGDRLLDPGRPAVELERVVRALHPHIGARVELGDGTAARRAAAPRSSTTAPARAASGGRTGLRSGDGRLLLDCTPGVLELLTVKPPGGRAMDAAAYLRGHPLPDRT